MEEEIFHDEIVEMLLIGVMTFIEDQEVYARYFDEPMHEKVIKLFRHNN